MKIEKFVPDEFAANNYILYNEKTKTAAIFDPSLCFSKTDKFIKENGLNLKYIFITHGHFDHLGDIKKFQDSYPDIRTYFPKNDKVLYDNLSLQSQMFGAPMVEEFTIDEFIDENSGIFIDDIKIQIIETPGHSKGSTCYLINDFLISGDTLFLEEIGRCDLPTGSFNEISHSIKGKLFNLDDNIKVFTGHGDNTTIGHEKQFNAYFGKNAIY